MIMIAPYTIPRHPLQASPSCTELGMFFSFFAIITPARPPILQPAATNELLLCVLSQLGPATLAGYHTFKHGTALKYRDAPVPYC